MGNYADILKDPRWQRRRLERLELAGWQCENCSDKEKTLHVHHPIYFKGRKPWEYTDDELQVLCELCHSKHHAAEAVLKRVMASNSEHGASLQAVVAGYLDAGIDIDPDDIGPLVDGNWYSWRVGLIARLASEAPGRLQHEILELLTRGRALNPSEERALHGSVPRA